MQRQLFIVNGFIGLKKQQHNRVTPVMCSCTLLIFSSPIKKKKKEMYTQVRSRSVCDPLTCIMSTIFLSSAGLIPDACCMVKPLKFSISTKPLICVSSFSSSFSKMTQ